MAPALEHHGIPWDEEWNRIHFESRDNFSVLRGDEWVGLVSLETRPGSLTVHSVQLVPEFQGSGLGIRILHWLVGRARASGCETIKCRALAGTPVIALYQRLGFRIDEQGSRLVDMSLDLTSDAVLYRLERTFSRSRRGPAR